MKTEVAVVRRHAELKLLRAQEAWGLLETLLWINRRADHKVSEVLAQWRAGYPTKLGHADVVVRLVKDHARIRSEGPREDEYDPQFDLISALRDGTIRATGYRTGATPRTGIPAEHWNFLVLGTCPPDWADQSSAGIVDGQLFWALLEFDRDDILKEFPGSWGQGAGEADWELRPGQMQKDWVTSAATVAEAVRRRDRPSERSLSKALAQMARECDPTLRWTAEAIAATRRRIKAVQPK